MEPEQEVEEACPPERSEDEQPVEDSREQVQNRLSLEQWLRRNLNSKSAIRKLAAGAIKGLVEVSVSLFLGRLTVLFVTLAFGPIPEDLFSALPGQLTLGGVFFFIYYAGGIKDTLGPN